MYTNLSSKREKVNNMLNELLYFDEKNLEKIFAKFSYKYKNILFLAQTIPRNIHILFSEKQNGRADFPHERVNVLS